MRVYIRHPTEIPIEFELADVATLDREYLNNVSIGGLCFRSPTQVRINAIINVRIPVAIPAFEARGRVIWCHTNGHHYDIGVEFLDRQEAYRTRMVEQICHIEQYKKDVFKKHGRVLNSEQAAIEWIFKYAQDFPNVE